MRIWGTSFHIVHDSELKRRDELELALKRRFTPEQWQAIREGRAHVHRNPVKKEKVAA